MQRVGGREPGFSPGGTVEQVRKWKLFVQLILAEQGEMSASCLSRLPFLALLREFSLVPYAQWSPSQVSLAQP